MAGRRQALIVANDRYEHDGLGHLPSAGADAGALGAVLRDPQVGGFEVRVVRNEPAHVIGGHIEDLFADSRADDVLLLHFSCHGLKSESGELFFAARNTRPNRLGSTAVSADFVQRCMRASRSRSVVLLLDCCFGGAFSQGVTVRTAGGANVFDSFPGGKLGGGRGRAVITASSAMEYAFEGERLTGGASPRPSVFTSVLVEGMATGAADRDEDGWISLNELYDYVFDRVRERNPNQTPSRDVEMQGELYIARSPRQKPPPPIPPATAVAAPPAPPDRRSRWPTGVAAVMLCAGGFSALLGAVLPTVQGDKGRIVTITTQIVVYAAVCALLASTDGRAARARRVVLAVLGAWAMVIAVWLAVDLPLYLDFWKVRETPLYWFWLPAGVLEIGAALLGAPRRTRPLELLSGGLTTTLGLLILYLVNQESSSAWVPTFSGYLIAMGLIWILTGLKRRTLQ